jgi:hypothetical protein
MLYHENQNGDDKRIEYAKAQIYYGKHCKKNLSITNELS